MSVQKRTLAILEVDPTEVRSHEPALFKNQQLLAVLVIALREYVQRRNPVAQYVNQRWHNNSEGFRQQKCRETLDRVYLANLLRQNIKIQEIIETTEDPKRQE